jgi:hypothetical protein
MWEPRRLTTLWAFTASYRDSFTFFFTDISTESIRSIDVNLFLHWHDNFSRVSQLCCTVLCCTGLKTVNSAGRIFVILLSFFTLRVNQFKLYTYP